MSIICSALFWLKNEEARIKSASIASDTKNSGVDWFEAITSQEQNKSTHLEIKLAEKLESIESRIQKVSISNSYQKYRKSSVFTLSAMKSTSSIAPSSTDTPMDETEYQLDEYWSDKGEDEEDVIDDETLNDELPQIIYTSRTHSQISQFIHEIQKTIYRNIRCITLGSRKQYCVNPVVNNSSHSESKISELCLQMQQQKKSHQKKVEQNKSQKNQKSSQASACEYHCKSSELFLADVSLSKLQDIEDLAKQGKTLHICPFYGSRRAIKDAQLICMPYNLLINQEARLSLGISTLKNKVIIFDESHNILETMNSIYSSIISTEIFGALSKYLYHYVARFKAVLGAKNLFYLNTLSAIVKNIQGYILKQRDVHDSQTKILSTNDFIFATSLDNINFLKIKSYLKVSNLSKRLGGFIDHQISKSLLCDEGYQLGTCCAMLRQLQAFLGSMVNRDTDGRVILVWESSKLVEINYASLNASIYFTEIVRESRSGNVYDIFRVVN